MKLDRNENDDGLGKYAVINLRKLSLCETGATFGPRWTPGIMAALKTLEDNGALEWGRTGERDEFFLIKLKDINAEAALLAYADHAHHNGDEEFAREVVDLSQRAGPNSPFCKRPD